MSFTVNCPQKHCPFGGHCNHFDQRSVSCVSLSIKHNSYSGSFLRCPYWLKSFIYRNFFFLQKSSTHLFKPKANVISWCFKDGCNHFLPIWRSYQIERKTIGIKATCNCFIKKLSCLHFECLIQGPLLWVITSTSSSSSSTSKNGCLEDATYRWAHSLYSLWMKVYTNLFLIWSLNDQQLLALL